jgi:Ser-tRNA(Ala) deacylase AlaX
MTKKLFWQDPYLTNCTTTVTAVNGPEVQVSQSIFYAFSGGQESDQGSIGGWTVLDARKEGLNLIYTLPENHDLTTGQIVEVQIDWPRRYALMRLHFAAELVLELVYRDLGPIEKIGAHIAADKSRIDFSRPTPITEHLPALTEKVNQVIAANLPIESAFSDEAKQRRYWRIEGFGQVPCGGTHLKATSEVGPITLRRKNLGKGKERIEIYLTRN